MGNTLFNMNDGGKIKIFPSAIVVFNITTEDEGQHSRILSANPGMPVLFLATKFNRNVFSQAEGHVRTFIFADGPVNPASVDPEYPAQWISAGDYLPGLPGNLSVSATGDGGFRITSLSPDPRRTVMFRASQ